MKHCRIHKTEYITEYRTNISQTEKKYRNADKCIANARYLTFPEQKTKALSNLLKFEINYHDVGVICP
jgi:hypothetical protein